MVKLIDMADRRFGRLLVLSRGENTPEKTATWLCRCDCGVEITARGPNLRRGNSRSCGCLNIESISKRSRTHNEAGVLNRTAEYRIWSNMLTRCRNKKAPAFKDYGARGIDVCERWLRYENFLEDMGRRPSSSHSIERKENNSGYSKENCMWADIIQQARNKRNSRIVEFEGRKISLAEAAELAGASYATVWFRLKSGWTVKDALYGRS